jgi:hypothetical protein
MIWVKVIHLMIATGISQKAGPDHQPANQRRIDDCTIF